MNDHFLIFRLSERRCALPLTQVERVVQAVELTPFPHDVEISRTSALRGVMNVHGEVVPVFDLRPASALRIDEQMILVLLPQGRRAALLCDRVESVHEASPQALASARKLLPDGMAGTAGKDAIITDEFGLVHLQDLEALLLKSVDAVTTLLESATL